MHLGTHIVAAAMGDAEPGNVPMTADHLNCVVSVAKDRCNKCSMTYRCRQLSIACTALQNHAYAADTAMTNMYISF